MNAKFVISLIIIGVLFFGVLGFMLITGKGLQGHIDPEVAKRYKPITLRYWRVFDGVDDGFRDVIGAYQAQHPNIKIEYKKLRYDEYEQALLEGFATDRGPDIFSIHNTWMRKYQEKGMLFPAPAKVSTVHPYVKSKIKKEIGFEIRERKTLTPNQIENYFVDVVYDDVILQTKDKATGLNADKLYGIPLGIDTLVMFYNKELFNNAGIVNPPQYWNTEFQEDVKKLTKQNNKGELVQSGVAIGGAYNIERATDILSVLMMQGGTEMMKGDSVKFHQIPSMFQDRNHHPGVDALRFYTDFANPAKEVYSWSEDADYSLDMFVQNKLAMMFGYSYMIDQIKTRAPQLNFAIAKLPQIENNTKQINYANYWLEVVANKTDAPEEAWDFLHFLAQKDNVKKYLEATKKSTALRSLLDEQLEDEEIGLFAEQVLAAESWYKGNEPLAMEKIVKDMIKDAVVGQRDLNEIISLGAKKVQQTVK